MNHRHRDHYFEVARRATRTWGTGEQVGWFRRLADDYGNLREALDRCRGTPEGMALGLEVSARLGIAWQAIGRVGEGQRWIATFLSGAPDDVPARPLGLWASGYMALARRDLDAAEADLTEARAGAAVVGDEETESWAISHLGLARLFRGEHAEARQLLLDSVERHRSGGRPGVAAFMLADAALAATLLGRADTAVPEFEEAIAVSREVGDEWTWSHALWGLGVTRLARGEPTAAEEALLEALRLIRGVGDATGTALAVEALALAAAHLEQPRRAASLTGVADAVWRSIPARPPGPAAELRREAIAIAEATLGQQEVARLAERSGTEEAANGVARALGEIDDPAADAQPVPARPQLSRREEQVAALVATGMTNRQIADRLVLSPRTIESHVERIMNRLGIGSRAEIAAWATRHLAATESHDIP
jgi:non-specific serine/threonine protein kinase